MSARVLLVANNFPPVRGGSSAVYDNIARFAAGAVDVLAPCINYADGLPLIAWREQDRRAPYDVHRLHLLRTILQTGAPSKWRRARLMAGDVAIRIKVLATILRLARRRGYEAVCLGELLASGWLIRPLQRLTGMRVIVYVHGEEITTHDPRDPLKRRCMRLLRQADGIVVVSRFTQSVVLDLLGPDVAARMALIHNGVASGVFTPGPKRPDLLVRHHLGDAFVFVSVCRLLEKKGIDNALRAFAAIAARHGGSLADSRFLIVGTGPYGPALAALAGRLGIADRVVFAGAAPEADLSTCIGWATCSSCPTAVCPTATPKASAWSSWKRTVVGFR